MWLLMSAQLTRMETRIGMDYSSHGDASVDEEIKDVVDEEDGDWELPWLFSDFWGFLCFPSQKGEKLVVCEEDFVMVA